MIKHLSSTSHASQTVRAALEQPLEPLKSSPLELPEQPPKAIPVEHTPKRAPITAEQRAGTQAKLRQQEATLARTIREPEEQRLVGGHNKPSQMIDLGGDPKHGLAMTIHGINGAPEDVDALSNRELAKGAQTRTVVYDDNYRRLGDTVKDVSGSMEKWLKANPGRPLTVDAHSMGSRVSLAALDDLNKKGLLDGRKVELNMVAPPLGGYGSANMAGTAPDFVAGLIKNLRPAKDMGTASDFQERLEAVRLPDNVKVRVFTAGKDTVVDYDNPHFKTIVENLHAQVINLPESDHVNSVEAAAKWLQK